MQNKIIVEEDSSKISASDLTREPHARILSFEDLLPLLISPDSQSQLNMRKSALTDGQNSYPMRGGIPILLPSKLQDFFTNRLNVPYLNYEDSFLQYFLLASIKQSGEINSASSDEHYQRHLFRMKNLLSDCSSYVLDIGCDDPLIGASLFPESTRYVGLDPFCFRFEPFRIVGVAEYLPFANESFGSVVFNTSLDHILDWRRAIDEALRVLVKGGSLYICTLIWTTNAELFSDSVHFHHFREYEILGGLGDFEIQKLKRYDYKGNSHRYGLYLKAVKK